MQHTLPVVAGSFVQMAKYVVITVNKNQRLAFIRDDFRTRNFQSDPLTRVLVSFLSQKARPGLFAPTVFFENLPKTYGFWLALSLRSKSAPKIPVFWTQTNYRPQL